MPPASPVLLARLGNGESIASLCASAGMSREEFDAWWRSECARRVPPTTGTRRAAVRESVRIGRDRWGIPHVDAANDDDLFFGFGYATAQDRLYQLDYLRRRALGRLSETLGPETLELDLTARTVGLPRIAEAEWQALPEETRRLLEAYSCGVCAMIDDSRGNLPIEFALLGYEPEPWRPQDSLAIAGEFRWYLTGRFPVIVIPELARRTLGAGPLYDAFLAAEADEESILPMGAYPARKVPSAGPSGQFDDATGSNNWVVSGDKSASGKPLVASDPHIAFAAVSCWHEVHLSGGSFQVAGMAYAGMPAVMFGRNERVAWGITNNICSLRDLYQERTDPAHPGCFQFDGRWEPAREVEELIHVKGREPLRTTIRSSRHGPIVDEILPLPARGTGPVSLRWQGADPCGWLTALLGMDRARTCDEFRAATAPWRVPTFCLVYGDVDGHIGYQCSGSLPLRSVAERGYRPGWDPAHQWTGLIPVARMPHWSDPARGWIGTANNRVAADDFPYPLSGTWSSGFRAARIREMLEGQPRFCREDFARMHQDSVSLRAALGVPALVETLSTELKKDSGLLGSQSPDARRVRVALEFLATWDCRMEPDRVAASIFNVFFAHWSQRVAETRFPGDVAALVAPAIGGLAADLLADNRCGWFTGQSVSKPDARRSGIVQSFLSALGDLEQRLGPDPLNWGWGRLHTLQQKHFLSGRGALGELLDRGGVPVRGDFLTVCNTGQAPDFTAPTGAGYRMIADLGDPQAALWAVDAGSESGHPGSAHYDDQLGDWLTAQYHCIPLKAEGQAISESTLTLAPAE